LKILVLSVGRPDRARFGPMFDEYVDRIRKFGVTFDARWVPELRIAGRYTDEHVREREAEALRGALPERVNLVALAPQGEALSTEAFARRLERWSHPQAAFVVGGPLGLHDTFTRAAGTALSLSAMTLPHELARVVLAEQIFRALSILRGLPYHK
jgi:23S rRNA (pseudouridine1915-N3)-methyltransferase